MDLNCQSQLRDGACVWPSPAPFPVTWLLLLKMGPGVPAQINELFGFSCPGAFCSFTVPGLQPWISSRLLTTSPFACESPQPGFWKGSGPLSSPSVVSGWQGLGFLLRLLSLVKKNPNYAFILPLKIFHGFWFWILGISNFKVCSSELFILFSPHDSWGHLAPLSIRLISEVNLWRS